MRVKDHVFDSLLPGHLAHPGLELADRRQTQHALRLGLALCAWLRESQVGQAGIAVLFIASAATAADIDEFKVKREAVFEFAQKPKITRQGDRVTVAFEAKGLCDVTIAVEDEKGRIICHLASGVLGPNALAPFQKDTKVQTVVWDGKNDLGEYLDNKDALTVRVSLGLKPQFERTLFWSPYKRISPGNRPNFAAAPEGVYVHEGGGVAADSPSRCSRSIASPPTAPPAE